MPDLISLRVITQALQGFAQECKSRIFRGVSFLSLAACCTVLRSQWYQNSLSFGLHRRGPVGPLGRAANLTLSVHDLGCEVTGVEVGHEAAYLAALYLQDAHAVVGDSVAVGGGLRGPLQRRPLLCGEHVSERGLHLFEGLAILCPELAQSLVASEGL